MDYTVAVVGATGLVGRKMVELLEQRSFPVRSLRLLSSARGAGSQIAYRGRLIEVQEVSEAAFTGVDIALFSAGGTASREWAPVAVEQGAVVVDNSSAWRMIDGVPLIVPEVNPAALPDTAPRIIANPNCSTIQLVVALRPLQQQYGLKRVSVATYQAVSGAGKKGVVQLEGERAGTVDHARIFPHRIDGNALPQIADFAEDGFTLEEHKMMHETRKIPDLPQLPVAATCVRIPVRDSHSEAVQVELQRAGDIASIRELLATAPGIVLQDEPGSSRYPLAADVSGSDEVYVGRLRVDPSVENGIMMWIVADNVRKGAATNAVQIAELWRTLREQ